MRISDWSSDVCSSDLTIEGDPQGMQVVSAAIGGRVVSLTRNLGQSVGRGQTLAVIESREAASLNAEIEAARARLALAESNLRREQRLFNERVRSEEHTSELQSLMRISYAVFCLKTNN